MGTVSSGHWADKLIKENEQLLNDLASIKQELNEVKSLLKQMERKYGEENNPR